jgi:hypothetical protein
MFRWEVKVKKVTTFILILLATYATSAQLSERLTDKDIKALIETIEQDRNRFNDSVDDKMKNVWYRSVKGEVKIALVLENFIKNVNAMKERFTKDYSASAEAASMLQQASIIDSFFKEHPGTKSATEWEHLAVDLRALANAYGTEFPLPDGAIVRRINDKETATAADSLIRTTNQFKKEISRDKTLAEELKETYKHNAEELIKQAVTVRARSWDSKTATEEAKSIMDLAVQIEQSLERDQTSSSITSAWKAMQASLQKLRSAFALD